MLRDYPRLFDEPSWESGCRRKTPDPLTGLLAKVHVGGKTSTLRGRFLRENHWLYNAVCPVGAIYTTIREPGDTTRLPMTCSHEQAGAGGLPPALGGQLPKGDRLTYSTSVCRVSNNHAPSATRYIPCESRQAFLPQIDTLHAWPGRSLRTDSRSVLPSEILLRMREAVPVEPFGRAMLHCGVALGLNPQAAELPPEDEHGLSPYRRSLVGWRLLCAFRSHTVIQLGCPSRTSLSSAQLQQMLTDFLEVVSFEVCPFTKKDSIGWPLFSLAVFESGQLNSTYIIGDLKQSIGLRIGVAVYNGVSSKRLLERAMKNPGYKNLTVVVINLYGIEGLERGQVFLEICNKVSPHACRQFVTAAKPVLLICEDMVEKWRMGGKGAKSHKMFTSVLNIHATVCFLSSEQRRQMQRNVGKAFVAQGLFIQCNGVLYLIRLIMEHECNEVVLRFSADIARFIDKNGKFPHKAPLPRSIDKKNAGGNPPALDSPLLQDDRYPYSTSRCQITRPISRDMYGRSAA